MTVVKEMWEEIERGQAEKQQLRSVLSELVGLMQGVIDGDYKPDCFTLQPARTILGHD